jgi:hypothetical protein
MRATLFLGLVACAGCSQILGIGDIAIVQNDAAVGGEPGAECFGHGLVTLCPKNGVAGSITLADVNTDTDMRCENLGQPTGPEVCLIAAQDITVSSDANVTGSRPLVLAARTTITINATFDASSTKGHTPGAGSNETTCAAGPGANDQTNGGSGGAGGTFGGKGGNGGSGGGGSLAGQATEVATLSGVRGGCPGGRGGNAPATDIGGDSGGSLYLIANTSITLGTGGHIYAGGAGGRGGNSHDGGYGGGSGGLIGLEAPTIALMNMASIAANGGGAGEGGSSQAGTSGRDGEDAGHDMAVAKGGGGGTASGGDGGDGGAGGMVNGTTDANANGNGSGAGGGGGGGSAGIVWVKGTLTGGTVSPAPQNH